MSAYFRNVPDFDYVSRLKESNSLQDYVKSKNLFRRAKLREDIFGDLSFFTKYKIIGDERPDQLAYKFYNDETLDWVILISNNVLNVQSEWPLAQNAFDKHLLYKYGSYDKIYQGIHHYETTIVQNSFGYTIVPEGLEVPSNYSVSFYDEGLDTQVTRTNITTPITNYTYELRIDEEKRNIFILKSKYLNVIINDLEEMMQYKKGSTQYVSRTLKRGDNIKLLG
jgi:hypothetical protein